MSNLFTVAESCRAEATKALDFINTRLNKNLTILKSGVIDAPHVEVTVPTSLFGLAFDMKEKVFLPCHTRINQLGQGVEVPVLFTLEEFYQLFGYSTPTRVAGRILDYKVSGDFSVLFPPECKGTKTKYHSFLEFLILKSKLSQCLEDELFSFLNPAFGRFKNFWTYVVGGLDYYFNPYDGTALRQARSNPEILWMRSMYMFRTTNKKSNVIGTQVLESLALIALVKGEAPPELSKTSLYQKQSVSSKRVLSSTFSTVQKLGESPYKVLWR